MDRPVRISGLIRIAENVRRELAAPIAAQRRERLREHVRENLDVVRGILRANNAGPERLPAPSRRAYRFLADLDWTALPAAPQEEAAPAKPPTMLAWRGLGGLIDRAIGRLGTELSAPEIAAQRDIISRTSRQIELTLARTATPPDRLTAATREQRGWLAFFSRPENLSAYVQARQRAGQILDRAAAGSRHFPPPLALEFRPMKGIFKLRATRGGPVLSMPTPMIAFDEPAFVILARLVFARAPDAKRQAIELMTGTGYQAVRAELESLGGIVEQTRGAVHDLSASFNRVNAAYFAGQMPRPRLTWNRTFTGRKFGHYDWILDTVMVSRTLDSAGLPEFVVDFLVFHELLHKFHGVHWVNGRGYAHTAEFYASERKFAQYAQAEAMLKQLARAI
ncbi:MAG TPA: hypothetical protein VFC78_02030 [Tepidisphaeraceae bacterium]|nr:hypothetical protein [Tepidisphaeraceae bacterium]